MGATPERVEQRAGLGSWKLLLPSNAWIWSDGMHRLHGVEPGHPLPRGAQAILERVQLEERERVGALLAGLEAGERPNQQDLVLEYWARSETTLPRRVRLDGELGRTGIGTSAWVGVAQDVTEMWLATRALDVLEAGLQALAGWRSFRSGLHELVRRVAGGLGARSATAWSRDVDGRLEVRLRWSAAGAAAVAGSSGSGSGDGQRAVARAVWAMREPVVRGSCIGAPAMWQGDAVAVLTFEGSESGVLDERLAHTLRWLGSALGRILTGDRPELGSEPRLSARELEVLQLAANGYSGPAIARELFISPATVKSHLLHVYEKLGVNDRAAAVAHALRHGLIA